MPYTTMFFAATQKAILIFVKKLMLLSRKNLQKINHVAYNEARRQWRNKINF